MGTNQCSRDKRDLKNVIRFFFDRDDAGKENQMK
jgi:hypothetical protein